MDYILKLLSVALLASIKYFWATPYSFGLKLNELETIFFIETGGIFGFLFFYYAFGFIFKELKLLWPIVYHFTPVFFKVRFQKWWREEKIKRLNSPKFTKKNKFVVQLRRRYGMWGLIILTPIILSIPLGALIGNKYFNQSHHFIFYMLISIGIWGIISVLFFSLFMNP